MTKDELKMGTKVYLISGGPAMAVGAYYGNGFWTCNWFDQNQVLQKGLFVPEQLTTEAPKKYKIA